MTKYVTARLTLGEVDLLHFFNKKFGWDFWQISREGNDYDVAQFDTVQELRAFLVAAIDFIGETP